MQKELDVHLLVTRLAHVPRHPSEGPLREVLRDFGSLRSGSNKNNRLSPQARDIRGVFSVARVVSTTVGRTALIRKQQSLPFWDIALSCVASLALTVMFIIFLEYPRWSAQ